MYDRQTRSLWSQVQGRAIAGSLEGSQLEKIPAWQTAWAEWRALHPETLVMVKPPIESSVYAGYSANAGRIGLFFSRPRDRRLPPKELVYGLQHGSAALAVPLALLDAQEVVHAELADRPLVVISRRTASAVRAFDCTVDGRALTFEALNEGGFRLKDTETGSIWDPASGTALSGPLAGQALTPVAGTLAYWDFWSRHHPGVKLVSP